MSSAKPRPFASPPGETEHGRREPQPHLLRRCGQDETLLVARKAGLFCDPTRLPKASPEGLYFKSDHLRGAEGTGSDWTLLFRRCCTERETGSASPVASVELRGSILSYCWDEERFRTRAPFGLIPAGTEVHVEYCLRLCRGGDFRGTGEKRDDAAGEKGHRRRRGGRSEKGRAAFRSRSSKSRANGERQEGTFVLWDVHPPRAGGKLLPFRRGR